MKTLLLLIISLLGAITAIGQQKLPDSHFTGILKDTNTDGKPIMETPYRNGKKSGIEKSYYESGSIKAEYPYKHDRLNGVYKEYFENGKLKKLITYVHGKREGIAQEFGGLGSKLVSIKTYKNDSLNGPAEEYYTHWFWRPECTNPYLKKDSSIENGKPPRGSEVYYVDSIVKKKINYKNGKLNGLSKEYYKSGKLNGVNTYINGKLNGISRGYYENGTLRNQVYYKLGRLYTAPIEYDKKGVIKSVSQTKSVFYNEKGQLIADTNYKITKKQMEKFIPVESYLKKYISDHLDFPEQSLEIDDTGYVIVSFKIGTTDTLQQLRIEKSYEKKNYLSKEVKRAFKKSTIPESAYSRPLRNKKYFLAVSFIIPGIKYKRAGCIAIMHYKSTFRSITN